MSRQVEDQDPETARKTRQEDENGPEEKRSKTETTRESCLDQPMDSSVVHEVVKFGDSHSQVAKYYDADTTEPIIGGLHSLEELLSWRRSEAQPFNVSTVPLSPREPPLSRTPFRTLVSHDMMGGYLDDRFLQGTDSELPYCFYHWNHIDIFNYFTHSMVTIPRPAGPTPRTDTEFWSWASAVKNMPLFLHYLTEQIHERVSGGLVLWYDSVVHTGKLTWQNQLNQNNRSAAAAAHSDLSPSPAPKQTAIAVLTACDGFFTNYKLDGAEPGGHEGFSAVQGRQADVYVGVDVFARGEMVVGGILFFSQPWSLSESTSSQAAIFAPGWVYETQDRTEFRHNQDSQFWGLLSDHLPPHRPVSSLPFTSTFCQGFGRASTGEERVLSLHLPLASSTLVCLVYKASAGVSVFLEMSVQEPNEDKLRHVSPVVLDEGHVLSSQFAQLCAFDSEHDWTVACALVQADGCSLRDLTVNISRDGEPQDTAFSCRLGQITLLDAYSLHLPSERVEGLCIYDVAWLPGSSEEPLLNATLRWSFRAAPACHYRVHWRRLRGPDPRTTAGPVRLVSRAYSQVFRVTELAVPRPPALLELLVEPVLKSGFVLPESQWGRARLSYNSDHTQGL
ncbi:hypothetical protein WMY93_001676 [Mugilogobius chulae]|uniref:mannosyl-glycoprotein endo-beta-N-acetylglucosaminidase n=1 Tax=Mugilogobius chulae TaxID=88201 RepID=A0AAW0PS10_9GOBI